MAEVYDLNPGNPGAALATADTGGDLEVAVAPDKRLALLQAQLAITPGNKDIIDQIDKRQSEVLKESGLGAGGFGSGGTFIPSLNSYQAGDERNAKYYDAQSDYLSKNAGKAVLTGGYKDAGLYSAEMIGANGERVQLQSKSNDPALKGTALYDPNATSKKSFFDATGKRLSAAEVAKTKTGAEFAAAGWDIGYGPGMIAPGVKADTSEREARLAESNTTTQESYSVDPTPLIPSLLQASVSTTPPPPPAKTAPIDTVLFDNDSVPIEVMTDLIFENIGGHELINIARNDIVNGQKISYSPIKNLTSIQQQYNPNNIISLQSTSDKYFANFSIKLDQKIPNEGNGPDGSNIYIEELTGDLIIETVNMENDEQVDIQIAISGTIYEADLGDYTS